jgi:hypothetical protein
MTETLQQIIDRLWHAPKDAEWTQKTDVVSLDDVRVWMASDDIELLGFTHHLLSNRRFRIEPPISMGEYVVFTKLYCERCFKENPDGEWSDSSYSAGYDLVNIFAGLWNDGAVPRTVLADLKDWMGKLYKSGDSEMRICIVNATLEHLFEQKKIRAFFSDWQKDETLRIAYSEASEWYQGGGKSPLGKPPFVKR